MSKKRLALIIPTYNRPQCVDYYLGKRLNQFAERNIDVIIFDSSTSEETKTTVQKYQKKGAKNLFYSYFHEEQIDIRSIDRKVYIACKKYAECYDYLWFSSDGTVFDIKGLWNELSAAMEVEADYIAVNHIMADDFQRRQYSDSRNFLCDYSWELTLIGANIISTKHLLKAVRQYPVITGDDFWYWLPLACFHLFAYQKIKAIVLGNSCPYEMNPLRADPFWKKNGDTIWQWAKIWPEAIDALPAYYDDIKEIVIRSQEEHMHVFTIKSLLGMKASGQISFKDVVRYKTYLVRVTETSILWFYVITLFGNRRILTAIRGIYRKVKKRGKRS